MKKHLFYTFLAIFAATAVITLLGITGVLRIERAYLTTLLTASLVELAAALIAIFRRTEFFTDDEQKHVAVLARMREEHADAITRLQQEHAQRESEHTAALTARLQSEIERLAREKEDLKAQLERVSSLKLRAWSLFNQAQSVTLDMILRDLRKADHSVDPNEVMSVVGTLLEEGKIEGDPMKPGGYYRLKEK